jgi:hypothetical protein
MEQHVSLRRRADGQANGTERLRGGLGDLAERTVSVAVHGNNGPKNVRVSALLLQRVVLLARSAQP